MSKHTPGPWEIDRDVRTSINKDAKHVALVNFYNSPDPERNVSGDEHEANVRLIAAAPDLLAALKEFVFPHQSGNFTERELREMGLAAIAKATGDA